MKKFPRLNPIAAALKSARPLSARSTLAPLGVAAAMAMSMNALAQAPEQAADAQLPPAETQAAPVETSAEPAAAQDTDQDDAGRVAADHHGRGERAHGHGAHHGHDGDHDADDDDDDDDQQRLPEVTSTAKPLDSYKPDVSTIGAKAPTAIRDIPQTVNIVNRNLMDSQNATTLADALRNVPGITMGAGEGGQIGDNVNLRGFTARTDIFLDGMRDRSQYKRDTFALDSVEVLKGPSSLFFGRGSTGGVINQVTKAPVQEEINSVTASVGTDSWYRATADINEPLSERSAYRVAMMIQDVDSTRDVVNNQDWGIAPSLRTAINDSTDLTLSGLIQHNRDIPDYGIPFNEGKPANVDRDRFFGNTDDYFNQDVYVGKARVDHRFSPAWTLRNQLQATSAQTSARPTPYRVCTDGFNNAGNAPLTACTVANVGDPLSSVFVQSDRRDRVQKDTSVYDQLDFIGNVDALGIKHQIVAGAEVGRDEAYNQAWTWSPRVQQSLGNFVPGQITAGETRTQAATHTQGVGDTLGLYANDTAALTQQIKLIAGLRWDRFKGTGQTITNSTGAATTLSRTDHNLGARAGVVYQPSDQQSYYVSYGSSFNPSTEAITLSAAQAAVAPERTRSYEIGTKWDVIEGNLSLSSALFRVDKSNARTTDTAGTGTVSLDGDTQVQGFEVGAVGRITYNWQITAGYTYLDSELVHAKDILTTWVGPHTSITAPVQGNKLANTPTNSGSIWTSYRFLHDYEIGGGAYYVGKRYLTNADVTAVDDYWRADATFAFHQPHYDVQLNVQNLFDADYFDSVVASENGRAVPGRGRTVIASTTYRF